MPQRIIAALNWSVDHYWNIVTAIFFAVLSYFADIKGAFHVMFAAFTVDMVLGIMASKKIKNEKFSMTKFFLAIYRMMISTALVMLLFAMDKEMHQDTVSLANGVAWLISGFLAYSAAENGYQLTGVKLFLSIKKQIKKKVKDVTGFNI